MNRPIKKKDIVLDNTYLASSRLFIFQLVKDEILIQTRKQSKYEYSQVYASTRTDLPNENTHTSQYAGLTVGAVARDEENDHAPFYLDGKQKTSYGSRRIVLYS